MTRIPDSITGDDGRDLSSPSLPTTPSAGLAAG
jgi:hypothetical protein